MCLVDGVAYAALRFPGGRRALRWRAYGLHPSWRYSNDPPLSSVLTKSWPTWLEFCLADPTPVVLQRKSSKYIDFAKSIMGALSADEVPTDLTDAHMLFKARDMFDGFSDQLSEEDVRDAMGAVSGLVKVCRSVTHSVRFLSQVSV